MRSLDAREQGAQRISTIRYRVCGGRALLCVAIPDTNIPMPNIKCSTRSILGQDYMNRLLKHAIPHMSIYNIYIQQTNGISENNRTSLSDIANNLLPLKSTPLRVATRAAVITGSCQTAS
jgi:hypothetical protein